MANAKEEFLKNDFIPLLKKLKPADEGKWGLMNAQQMVEHFTDAVKNANGKLKLPSLVGGEKLVKMRAFLLSEEPFKENTKNPLIPETGIQLRQPDLPSAIDKLKKELDYFFEVYQKDPELTIINSFFGELDYKMNVQLLYKHALHHLRQFGLV
ncbi:MAG TPA: hypothetical protein VIQ23_06225 [Hanamia sp.]|jgi:hypothetical protein